MQGVLRTSFDVCQGQSGAPYFTIRTTSSGGKIGMIKGIQCTIGRGSGQTYLRSINKVPTGAESQQRPVTAGCLQLLHACR